MNSPTKLPQSKPTSHSQKQPPRRGQPLPGVFRKFSRVGEGEKRKLPKDPRPGDQAMPKTERCLSLASVHRRQASRNRGRLERQGSPSMTRIKCNLQGESQPSRAFFPSLWRAASAITESGFVISSTNCVHTRAPCDGNPLSPILCGRASIHHNDPIHPLSGVFGAARIEQTLGKSCRTAGEQIVLQTSERSFCSKRLTAPERW